MRDECRCCGVHCKSKRVESTLKHNAQYSKQRNKRGGIKCVHLAYGYERSECRMQSVVQPDKIYDKTGAVKNFNFDPSSCSCIINASLMNQMISYHFLN